MDGQVKRAMDSFHLRSKGLVDYIGELLILQVQRRMVDVHLTYDCKIPRSNK
jgi:hypothetical protein